MSADRAERLCRVRDDLCKAWRDLYWARVRLDDALAAVEGADDVAGIRSARRSAGRAEKAAKEALERIRADLEAIEPGLGREGASPGIAAESPSDGPLRASGGGE